MLSASRATKKVFDDFFKKIKRSKKWQPREFYNIFRLAKGESILYTIICVSLLSPGNQTDEGQYSSSSS
jgi:hypothetical protein